MPLPPRRCRRLLTKHLGLQLRPLTNPHCHWTNCFFVALAVLVLPFYKHAILSQTLSQLTLLTI